MAAVGLQWLSVTWGPLLLMLVTGIAFWRSFAAILPLLAVEHAAGLTPVMPLLATWLVATTGFRQKRAGQPQALSRTGDLDVGVSLALLGVAGWLMWQAPQRYGWYFWSHRLDLLAAPLFALALAVLLWGVPSVLWHKLAVIYTLLIWPLPLVRLQELIAHPLALITSTLVRPLALAAGAHLAPTAEEITVFVSTGAFPWTIIIGDVCSGLNAGLTVALVGIPASVHLALPPRRAALWVLAGIGLALASNIVRVVVLLAVATRYGAAFAMTSVHPVLGACLLALVFGVLWRWAPVPPPQLQPQDVQSRLPAAPVRPRLRRPRLSPRLAGVILVIVSSAAIFAASSTQLAAFQPLPPIGPPGGSVAQPLEYLRFPKGWSISDTGTLAWQNLFGSESESYALNLRSEDGVLVKAQFVATPLRNRLVTFDLEACRVYQGDDVVGRRTIDLGAGSVAFLVDTWDRDPLSAVGRISVIYWHAPFSLNGREAHARVALFVVQDDEPSLPAEATFGLAPGGHQFDRADTLLVDLARSITREVLLASQLTPA